MIVNDTFYKDENDFGTTIYKVRVIDVQPLDSDEAVPEAPAKTTSVKPVDDSDEKVEPTTVKIETKINTDEETTTDKVPTENDYDDVELAKGSPEELDTSNNNEISKEIDEPSDVEVIPTTTSGDGVTSTPVTP